MKADKTIPKDQVRLYPPQGGEPILCREDQAERYLRNGWTKNKKRAGKAASEGEKS